MITKLMKIVTAAGLVACAGGGEEAPPPGEADLIDDLEDGDDAIIEANGRLGGWYTFNDETTAGTQVPPETGFVPSPGGAADSGYAASTQGSGFTVGGAGVGFDRNNPSAVGQAGGRGTYVASAFRGIAFSAKGNVPVRFALGTSGVTPSEQGGRCTPSTTEGMECDDLHGINLALIADWKEFQIELA